MPKSFASSSDLSAKPVSFEALADGVYAFTAEGDPNTGVVFGDRSVLVFDCQATPLLAEKVLSAVRKVTSLPIHYLVLSHYHAVRTLGASAFSGARVIASCSTDELINERGEQDWESELRRFPRLFEGANTVPGLTRPDIIFEESLSIDLGKRRVEILHPGSGHTAGDTILWLPDEMIMFAGDLVESGATPYCGDAYLRSWPETLSVLADMEPEQLVPGRGQPLRNKMAALGAIEATRGYVSRLYCYACEAVEQNSRLKQTFDFVRAKMDREYSDWVIYEHSLPFNVSRAFDEASEIEQPLVWTAERDRKIWDSLQSDS